MSSRRPRETEREMAPGARETSAAPPGQLLRPRRRGPGSRGASGAREGGRRGGGGRGGPMPSRPGGMSWLPVRCRGRPCRHLHRRLCRQRGGRVARGVTPVEAVAPRSSAAPTRGTPRRRGWTSRATQLTTPPPPAPAPLPKPPPTPGPPLPAPSSPRHLRRPQPRRLEPVRRLCPAFSQKATPGGKGGEEGPQTRPRRAPV